MAKEEKGAVGKLWTKHGRGYYALLAVGTFLYLEVTNLLESIAAATSVADFVMSELLMFFVETFIYTFMASFWPLIWYSRMGMPAVYWATGGYLVWAFLLAIALSRREKQMRKDLGLD
jgi:hypothetical protein